MMIHPQLANIGALEDLDRLGWVCEPKLDGIRALVHISDPPTKVTIYNRSGRNITNRFPDVVTDIHANLHYPAIDDDIFDGEIVCNSKSLYGDFQAIQTRMHRKTEIKQAALEAPAIFVAFDLLSNTPPFSHFAWRRMLLSRAYKCVVPQVAAGAQARDLMLQVVALGGEGVMMKDPEALYHPGVRVNSWLKIKDSTTYITRVLGFTPGTGARAPYFGALVTKRGNVGGGFSDTDLTTLTPMLHAGVMPDIEVKSFGLTNDGNFRFPSFVKLVTRY